MPLEELERELRAVRPQPDPEFGRRLDEWARAGFPAGGELDPRPRRDGDHRLVTALRRARERVATIPPRRLIAPAGALATLAVVTAVAITQSGELGGDDPAGGAETPQARQMSDAGASAAELAPAPDADVFVPPPPGGGRIAPGANRRLVEASARLVLGAPREEVQPLANRIVEVSDRHRGIVLDSSVTAEQDGARASFRLAIPAPRLDAALADLSQLGDLVSRTEAGRDITGQAVDSRRRLTALLADLRRARERLLALGEGEGERRRMVRSEIRVLKARAEAARARVQGLERRARFATVDVEVTSAGAAANDEWTIDEALDDAGRVLEVTAGVIVLSAAVLLPVAALVALAWLLATRWRSRSRERALDG